MTGVASEIRCNRSKIMTKSIVNDGNLKRHEGRHLAVVLKSRLGHCECLMAFIYLSVCI